MNLSHPPASPTLLAPHVHSSSDLTGSGSDRLVVKELIFLGTGTSGCMPYVRCLVLPTGCSVCSTTIGNARSRNRRRNTSLLVRIAPMSETNPDKYANVIIDVGKTFYDGSVEWFPEFGIRKIDAVILTHPHADAIMGIDDLRAWSTGSPFFKGPIPVHLHTDTMDTVRQMFPYCVDTSSATGGGLVPQLHFNVFDDATQAITVCGMPFVPLKVEHGEFGDGSPFYCFGYRFDDIVYVSDCNSIPAPTAAKMRGCKLMIMDALRPAPHKSHFGFQQSMDTILEYQPLAGLMVGFAHDLSHEELDDMAETYRESGKLVIPKGLPDRGVSVDVLHQTTNGGGDTAADGTMTDEDMAAWEAKRGRVQAVAPAFDGLRLTVWPDIVPDQVRGLHSSW